MACQGYGNISREEKEEYLRKKMEDMKKKSEEILRRHAEVEADKRNADMLSNMVSTKTQVNVQSQVTNIVKNVKNTSHVQKEKSSEQLIPEKREKSRLVEKQSNNQKATEENIHPAERMRSSWQISEENSHLTERYRSSRQISEENVHPTERPRVSRQMSEENIPPRRKDSDYRKQKLSEDDGPPPDPINYLSDPYRDGSFQDVDHNQDRNQDSRRHRSNYGGENFRNVKPIMQQRRNYERQHPPMPSSNSNLSVQMTGKERKEYENWKAERNKIDEERIARQKTSMGTWKREWDLNKNEQEEAAKRNDKQFYKQPRWISENGDHQEQNEKKSQGNRGHFNPSFDHRFDEKGDRSVIVNEHNTLTIVKNSEYEDDSAPQNQYQRNQGGKRVFERKQNASVSEERNFYTKKDTNWKQTDRTSTTLKGDGWEDAGAPTDGTKLDEDVSRKDIRPLQQSNNPDREWRTGTKFNQRKNDTDNKYNKGNSSMDLYDKFHKRQKSVSFEDFQEGMIRQDKKFSSDGWQGGRYCNNGRKHEDDWNKSKNDKSRKLSDGWENNDSISKTKDTRGRIISDGWEKEESYSKVNENFQRRPSDEMDDDPFSNSYYEHKQKRFSNQRPRGGSFRGKNSRVYSSSERGKSHLDSKQHEYSNPWPVSADNQQFRRKDNKAATDVEPQNFDRRWQNEGFDHKRGGGNQFWEGKRRGNDKTKTFRGQGSRGYGRNDFGTNKNSDGFQEYHNKNTHTDSQTSDASKYVGDVKNKKQISKDGWECESDKFQASSVNWLDNKEKISENTWKSGKPATIVNTVENASSQDSSEPDLQKQKVSTDTESHDDSWEDVTSGCESELSDQNEGISQASNFIESKLQSLSFDDDISKSDNSKHETNSRNNLSKTKMMDESDEHQDMKMNELGFCKDVADTFSDVTSEVNFASSHNDSIERILEEVYNDAINSEKNKCADAQEKSNEDISDVCHEDIISSTDYRISKNGIYDECLISSLDNTKSNFTEKSLLSSNLYCDINIDNKDGIVVNDDDEDDSICETTVLSLDCPFSDISSENSHLHSGDKNNDSCTYEPTVVLSLDSTGKCNSCQDDFLQPNSSSISDSNANITCEEIDTICSNSCDIIVAHSVDTDDIINKSSNASMVSAVKSVEESSNPNEVNMKTISNQTKMNLNIEVQQMHELAAVQDKNVSCADVTSDLEDSALSEDLRKEAVTEIVCSKPVVTEDCSTEFTTHEPSDALTVSITNTVKNDSSNVLLEATTDMDEDILSVHDSIVCESKQIDLDQDIQAPSVPVEYTLTAKNTSLESTSKLAGTNDICNKNNTYELNASTISAMKMVEPGNNNSQELHEKILVPAEACNEESKDGLSREVQEIHEIAVVQCDKHSRDQEELIVQDKINGYAEIVSACEDSAMSENNITSLEVIDKVEEANNTNEPSNSSVKSVEMSNSHKEFHLETTKDSTNTFSGKKTMDLHMDEQTMYEATETQINEDGHCQKLLEVMPHKNDSNCVSTIDNSVTSETTRSEQETVIPSTHPEHMFSNDIISLKPISKLEQTKDRKCSDVDIPLESTSDSNNAVFSNNSPSVDKNTLYLADIKEETVTDSEQMKEVPLATSANSDEATEQNLTDIVSSLDNDNTLHNFTPNTVNIKDPLTRTVRKVSATESTTEFTEVLDVTTSIPQRIVLQDNESAHTMNKVENSLNIKEYEQVTSSLNLDVRPPKS